MYVTLVMLHDIVYGIRVSTLKAKISFNLIIHLGEINGSALVIFLIMG